MSDQQQDMTISPVSAPLDYSQLFGYCKRRCDSKRLLVIER